MASRQWYLAQGQTIFGPLSTSELRNLASVGRVGPDDRITLDRQTWYFANTVAGLLPPRPAQQAIPQNSAVIVVPPPLPEAEMAQNLPPAIPLSRPVIDSHPRFPVLLGSQATRSTAMAWTVAIFLGGLFILSLGIVIGLTNSSTPEAPMAVAPAAPAPGTEATIRYWRTMMGLMNQQELGSKDMVKRRNAFTAVANSLAGLPTKDVDDIAVRLALEGSKLFRDVASVEAYLSSPEFLLNSFVRGTRGDPFGAVSDGQAMKSQLDKRFQDYMTFFAESQAALTKKYNVEFSQLTPLNP